jgi:exodeoxyribonuclease VII small subunit
MAAKLTYAQALQELEKIIDKMEDNETPLEELVQQTKKAKELIAYCETALQKIGNELDNQINSDDDLDALADN